MTRRTSRRALFGSAALLATLPAYARPQGPDRELIAVCGSFIAECERYEALEAMGPVGADGWREAAAIWAAWDGHVVLMDRLRACTTEGIQARALALHHHTRGRDISMPPAALAGRLLALLLRDAAALGGGA